MNSVIFKQGINPQNVHPAIWFALGIAYQLHKTYTPMDMVVTALNAGNAGHMAGSYHYPSATPSSMCQATDIRTEDLPLEVRSRWASAVTAVLKPLGYDVILESPETTGKPPHLHIEYQPHDVRMDWARSIAGVSGDYQIKRV